LSVKEIRKEGEEMRLLEKGWERNTGERRRGDVGA
jgi:hypothetical protein